MVKRFFTLMLAVFMLIVSLPISTQAATNPDITCFPKDTDRTIIEGEIGVVGLGVSHGSNHNKKRVLSYVYDSAGKKIAESVSEISGNYLATSIDITVDTEKLGMRPGNYTVGYRLEEYKKIGSYYYWRYLGSEKTASIKVIENICEGNHAFRQDYVWNEATCMKDGDADFVCKNCGHIVIKPLYGEHISSNWTKLNENQHQGKCTTCSKVVSVNHKWDTGVVAKQPTYTETGVRVYTCTGCGATKNETIDKLCKHIYDKWIKVDETNHKHICTICGETETLIHKWDSGRITTAPSCKDKGVRTYNCTDCGAKKIEKIEKSTEHTYDNESDITCNLCPYIRDKSASIASGTCGKNLTWRVTENGTLIISGTGNMYGYDAYGSQPWGDYALREKIKNVVIEPGVTSIGNYVFYGCKKMESIYIPDTVTMLGEKCFSNCSILHEIALPENVSSIPVFAFSSCSSLEYISFSDRVTSFGQECFDDCSSLTSFIIPEGTTKIAYGMFWGCNMLQSVQIPKSVTYIDTFAFHECGNLTDVYFTGSEGQYNTIEIKSLSEYNEGLLNATIHYSSKAPCITCSYGIFNPVDDNYHSRTCENCGKVDTATHTWDAGVITKKPNCKETGIKTYTCTGCGATKTEDIARTTIHTYGDWVNKDVTNHEHVCSVCEKEETAVHTWDAGVVTKEPNCKETGIKTYTCTVCKATKIEDIAKTTNHTYENWVNADEINHKHTCSVCEKEESDTHKWNDGVVTVRPTADKTGTRIYTCIDCGAIKAEELLSALYGDSDENSVINSIDAMVVLQYDVGLISKDDIDLLAADVDGNGAVNSIDAMLILQYDVGLITIFPVEEM